MSHCDIPDCPALAHPGSRTRENPIYSGVFAV